MKPVAPTRRQWLDRWSGQNSPSGRNWVVVVVAAVAAAVAVFAVAAERLFLAQQQQ
jgi:hypothetical protein